MTATPVFVGLDVAKTTLDVALRPSGEQWSVSNDEAGVASLVKRLRPLVKTPADRFNPAAQFAEALRGATVAPAATHRTWKQPLPAVLERGRRALYLATAVIMVFVAALYLLRFGGGGALPKETSAALQMAGRGGAPRRRVRGAQSGQARLGRPPPAGARRARRGQSND